MCYTYTIQYSQYLTAAGLAWSVERLTAEPKVAGSIPGTGPTLRVLNDWEMKILPLPCKSGRNKLGR